MKKMAPMKYTEKEMKARAPTVEVASASPADEYPYGLSLDLDKGALEKLGLDAEDLAVDGELTISGKAKVVSVSKSASASGKDQNVRLQITHLHVEPVEDETDLEDGFDKG
jgi:hypothetical protein